MLKSPGEFKSEDLPKKTMPNWKLAGPGVILVGLSIGAGEIVIWPRIVAEYGATMVWAAAVGVFLQMWINIEIGRWTIATGETVYTGYCRVWRGFAPLFILLTLLAWLAPGWGRASGLALKALLVGPGGWGSDTFWTAVTFAGVAVVLFGPKIVYKGVERTVGALVVLITVGLILVALSVGSAQTWRDLGKGMINVGHVEPEGKRWLREKKLEKADVAAAVHQLDEGELLEDLRRSLEKDLDLPVYTLDKGVTFDTVDPGRQWTMKVGETRYPIAYTGEALIATTPPLTAKAFFIALVFAGAGGTANLFYTFYLRDKHIGMGARIASMPNPLRSGSQKIAAIGYRFEDNDVNRRRFRGWWGFVCQDQILYFWLLNSLTMLLFIFGALAVLHPHAMVPGRGSLIWDQAQVLFEVWGPTGRTIFLLVGVATLFSTQLALIDGVSRSIADIVYTNFRGADKRDVSWWYMIVAAGWIVAGCAITFAMEQMNVSELGFLFNAAYMGGFAMAVYVPLTLYINWRYLPRSARPGALCSSMMVIASLVYVGFAITCIVWEIGKRF